MTKSELMNGSSSIWTARAENCAQSVAASLQSIRADVDLTTYVRNGSRCLSSCVLAFLQGDERIAGGASAWLFHGVCHAFANLPLPRETKRFVSLMAGARVSQEFLSLLESHITAPGEFWVSGYELYNVYRAGIITELLDPWRPIPSSPPPRAMSVATGARRPRFSIPNL